MKIINDLLNKKNKDAKKKSNNTNEETHSISNSIEANIKKIKQTLGESSDLVIRTFLSGHDHIKMTVIYIDGLADKKYIQTAIIEPLMDVSFLNQKDHRDRPIIKFILEQCLPVDDIQQIDHLEKVYSDILSGNTIIFVDGSTEGLTIATKDEKGRPVSEATTQTIVRGPKEAFTEAFGINISLIRKRLKDPNLRIENRTIGDKTNTKIAIIYLKGTADDKIVEELRRRLSAIKIDGILDSGYIEELIQDKTFTFFPTTISSERPDVVTANILEGRVAILVEGTPFVITVPVLFIEFFQASEDYYTRFNVGSFLRILRFISFFLSLLTPSIYIAATTFRQEMIPTSLLINLAAQREGVPFPAGIEASMMVLIFDILLEAGIRMPKTIGPTISIVGALVLGQAAVQAGLITAAMVIVISLTAISGFISPNVEMASALRLLRWGFIFLSVLFGLFGIVMGLIMMVLHLCSLRSFGVPYMSPIAPFVPGDQKDTFLRFPRWALFARPHFISTKNVIREKTPQPEPKRRH